MNYKTRILVEDTPPKELSIDHVDNNITATNDYIDNSLLQLNIANDEFKSSGSINSNQCVDKSSNTKIKDPLEVTPRGEINLSNERISLIASIILKKYIECRTGSMQDKFNPSTYSTKVLLNESSMIYGTWISAEDTSPKEPIINHVDNNITAKNDYIHKSLLQPNITIT